MNAVARLAETREVMEKVVTEHMTATDHGMSIEGPFDDGHFEIRCLGCIDPEQ